MQQDLNKLLEIASESEDGTRNASADHGVPYPFLGLKGRINRARYFLRTTAVVIPASAIQLLSTAEIIRSIEANAPSEDVLLFSSLILIAAIFLHSLEIVKRLHDIERPGAHFWMLCIPIYNFYLTFLLYFKKGTDGPNRYGPNPLDNHACDTTPFYAQAFEEIETNQIDKGLWAKAFADQDGDENKAKALYIKRRVALLAEHRRREQQGL